MKRQIFTLFLLVIGCSLASAAGDAASLLKACAKKITDAPSLNVSFTASADGQTYSGTLVMQGDKFVLRTPGMMTWYDGTTQWTFSSQVGEVNIVTPTPEEVAQINPLAIISSFTGAFTARTVPSKAGSQTVILKAKNPKSDVSSAQVTINDATGYPSKVTVTLSNRQTVAIVVDKVMTGSRLSLDSFRYNPATLPGVPVVDLR